VERSAASAAKLNQRRQEGWRGDGAGVLETEGMHGMIQGFEQEITEETE